MSDQKTIRFTLNGEKHEVSIPVNMMLSDLIREQLQLKGTKKGCEMGECGACTVMINNKAVNSCLVLAPQIDGCTVTTIEGISSGSELDPLQTSFVEHGATQCGYCTPGMIVSAKSLLLENGAPTETDVRRAISGHICRCSGYKKITEAILDSVK